MKYALTLIALVATLSFAGSVFDGGCADTFGISGYTKAWLYMFGQEDNDPSSSFRACNWTAFTAKLNDYVSGCVGTQFVSWNGSSSLQVCDAFLNMDIIPEISIKAGQFKVPFGWAFCSSGGAQYFLDRAVLAGTDDFNNFGGRDVGVNLHGQFDWVGIDLAYFNGTGAYTDADTSTNKEFAAKLTLTPMEWLTVAGGVAMIGEPEHYEMIDTTSVLVEEWTANGINVYALVDYPLSESADLIFEGEYVQAGWTAAENIGGEGKAGSAFYATLGVDMALEGGFLTGIMPVLRYESISPSYYLPVAGTEPEDNITVIDGCVNCYLTPKNTVQIGVRNWGFEADGVDGYTDMYLGWRMNF